MTPNGGIGFGMIYANFSRIYGFGGGDNVYADTADELELRAFYDTLKRVPGYAQLRTEVPVIGTWDDHDYGLNDGGREFTARKMSQKEFLNFMDVPIDSPRRQREGVYASHTYRCGEGSVKILVLDTRYFRSALMPDPSGEKRYLPHNETSGTVLGAAQWSWLEGELRNSEADFNILVSSIQLLSGDHGFETWGNFPHERDRLIEMIGDSGAKGVMVLSGDRHISEFSRLDAPPLEYPLIDVTSSGLTHAYTNFKGENNPYRVGDVVPQVSFGWIVLDFKRHRAIFQIRAEDNNVLGELMESY